MRQILRSLISAEISPGRMNLETMRFFLSAKDLEVCRTEGNPALKPHFMLLMRDENGLKES